MLNTTKKVVVRSPIALMGAFLLACSQPLTVLASTQEGYVPPSSRPRPTRTQGGGSRGCPHTQPVALQLLIPVDRTARTTVERPTFAWYLAAVPSMPLEFALTEEGAPQPVLVKALPVKRAGVMQFTLPRDIKGLQIGKEYRWTVSLICNSERPSQNVYARGWIERVATNPALEQRLSAATSARQKAEAYAQMGIWHDALATLLNTSATSTERETVLEFFQTLLHQIGLKETSAISLL